MKKTLLLFTLLTTITIAKNSVEIIHGHTLPPEPDAVVNNSTLLGVDSNDNGVRDDVERWIYHTYKDKHPIHVDIAMQAGRAFQIILKNPNQAKEISVLLHASQTCDAYYMIYAKYFNEPLLIQENIITKVFRKKVTNTQERLNAYWQYDTLLSGDTYSTPTIDRNMRQYCDFNTSKYEKP